jgi:hypothetical protein
VSTVNLLIIAKLNLGYTYEKLLFVLGMLIIGLTSDVLKAQTNVGGIISSNTNWSLSGSPYIVTGNILVDSGFTLTIEPGVTVKFNRGLSLQIDGELLARGTSSNKITFTSNVADSAGAWGYIYFSDNSVDAVFGNNIYGAYLSGSILEYCVVKYAGGANVSANGALRLNGAHPFINYCTISDNNATGIIVYNFTGIQSGIVKITNSTISHNNSSSNDGGCGIAIYGGNGNTVISGNIISSNNSVIAWGGGVFSGSSVTVTISDNIIINNTASAGGGGIRNAANATISNNLIINNTAFTAEGGGISDGGSATISNNIIADNISMNFGGGIGANSYSTTVFKNHIVRNTVTDDAGIFGNFSYGNNITSNTIAYNKNTDSSNTLNRSIYIAYYPTSINNNNIFNNSTFYELYNDHAQGTPNINAINNWWGTSNDLQVKAKIYDWSDNGNLGIVNYSPFLTKPDTSAPVSPPVNVIKSNPGGGQVKLTWSRNPEPDIAGYHIYYGGFNGYSFTNFVNAGNDTSYVLSSVSISDTIGITAYNKTYSPANELDSTIVNVNMTNGNESWYAYAVDTSATTGIIQSKNTILNDYGLYQNYPNPFNPSTVISYQVASIGKVNLKVFDLLGREVAMLVNEVKSAGNYKVTFNAANLPSGVYFYMLQAGKYAETKKLVLIK